MSPITLPLSLDKNKLRSEHQIDRSQLIPRHGFAPTGHVLDFLALNCHHGPASAGSRTLDIETMRSIYFIPRVMTLYWPEVGGAQATGGRRILDVRVSLRTLANS